VSWEAKTDLYQEWLQKICIKMDFVQLSNKNACTS
jgi:hypothetical protein